MKNLRSLHYIRKIVAIQRILRTRDLDFDYKNSLSSLPWIPVRLFKHYDFTSINRDNIYKYYFPQEQLVIHLQNFFR